MRTQLNELYIGEFEAISTLLNDKDLPYIDKWSDIFIILGMTEGEVNELDVKDFISIINSLAIGYTPDNKVTKEITLNGRVYSHSKEEFSITVKEMRLMEAFIYESPEKYIGEALAVVYKDKDLDASLHFDPEHLRNKAKSIREQVTADVAMPILNKISGVLIDKFKIMENEKTA